MHIPVMQEEILNIFSHSKLITFFDGTLGGGGHAEALLEAHPEIAAYIGCDLDEHALKKAKKKLDQWKDKMVYKEGNFSDIQKHLADEKKKNVDGILFDLGVSSFQLDEPEKGFSFSKEGPLDMRMGKDAPYSAEEVVNEFSEKKLGEILRLFGEEPKWKKVAKAICDTRRKKRIQTTSQLKEVIERTVPRRGKRHPATLTFQALRIFINNELGHIEKGIRDGITALADGGIFIVISFHSLEDRIVKHLFREHKKEMEILTKKPLIPTRKEISSNRRSRSAKLRAIQKC